MPVYTSEDNNISTIQILLDSALDGDVILVPSGEVTWTSSLNFDDNKSIQVIFNGTIVNSNLSTFVIYLRSGSRISGLTLNLINDNGVGIYVVGNNFRIDNCNFNYIGGDPFYIIEGVHTVGDANGNNAIGVVDHCNFNGTRALTYGNNALMANKAWAQALNLGQNNCTFFEDCIFNSMGEGHHLSQQYQAIDSNYGGRFVLRHCVINDGYTMTHSINELESRAAKSWEVYNNTFYKNILDAVFSPIFFRGGTGVIFNNSVITSESLQTWQKYTFNNIVFDNVRVYLNNPVAGLVDGNSPWDGNLISAGENGAGYWGRDQIGRAVDVTEWTEENPYPDQNLNPTYIWNNIFDESPLTVHIHNDCDHYIVEDRDYILDEMLDYLPFTYPHPLTETLNFGEEDLYNNVIYNGNENTSGTVPIDSNNYNDSDEVEVLNNSGNLIKSGYTFGGWNTGSDGNGITYQPEDIFEIIDDIILYALWIEDEGGTMGIIGNNTEFTNAQGFVKDRILAIASGIAPETGNITSLKFYVKEWLSSYNSKIGVYSGNIPTTKVGSEQAVIFVNATANKVWLSFSVSIPIVAGTRYWICICNETDWTPQLYHNGDLSNIYYSDNAYSNAWPASIISTPDASYGLFSAYAEYTATPATYNITYNGNGNTGGNVPVDSNNYNAGNVVTVLGNIGNLTKDGYTFLNWNTQADGEGISYNPLDTFNMPASNVTLYAIWTLTPIPSGYGLKEQIEDEEYYY